MIGESLLHYEIKESIGKGGMGEVYRARDTKLGRDVAVKILPADLSGDPEREARFQREARALATLQHPNVASVYGFEEVGGTRFLVMELVSGSDLTQRIKAGPSAVDEVLPIARQIAAGLEAAHESGIVHRDLKPANIMQTEDGEIKILDFGLAQAWLGDGTGDSGSSLAPTITAAMTQAGAVLGTAAYMSPEQARGSRVDRRTDIWAFGVILFELLTGKQLFQGETVSDTLAAVLRAEPEWDALPVAEAPGLCHLIERCLVRDPKQRLRDIGEARIFLQDGDASGSHLGLSKLDLGTLPAEAAGGGFGLVRTLAVAVVCLTVGAAVGWKILDRPQPAPVLHAMLPPPAGTDYDLNPNQPGPAVISPDGSMVTFTAADTSGISRLYLRHLDQGDAVAMSGTETAAYPFWSADSRSIGFFEMKGGKLRKVAVTGGPPVTICPASNGKGGSWNKDGVIIFAPSHDAPINRVPAMGGDPVAITTIPEGYDSDRHPRFLPDGRHFIYTARTTGSSAANGVFLASLDTTVAQRLIAESQANADYAGGCLLTVREGVLMATPYTPDQERASAGATPLVENVLRLAAGAAVAVFSPSRNGMLVYQTGASAAAGQVLYWTDAVTGARQPLGESGQLGSPVVSPDGTRAVLPVLGESEEGTDLWLVDLQTGLRTRFTFAAGDETWPVWSHDGAFVFYAAHADSEYTVVRQPVEGRGGAVDLLRSTRAVAPTDVAPDDHAVLLDWTREDGKNEMRRLALDADGAAGDPEVAATDPDKNLGGGRYSPDGRWIAYHTQTAAGWDVFVMPAEGGARKWQVTTTGCVYPRWNPDGTEIWVSEFSGNLRAYQVDGSGSTFRVGAFRRTLTVTEPDVDGNYYDLAPDGRHVLEIGNDPAFRAQISYLHLVTDWRRGLMR